MKKPRFLACFLIALHLALAGCATQLALRDARNSHNQGKFEESLQRLAQALDGNPTDPQLRTAYLSLRDRALQKIQAAAEEARRSGDTAAARTGYQRMLAIDRDNARARTALQELERDARHQDMLAGIRDGIGKAGEASAIEKLRRILAENPGNKDAKSLLLHLEEKSARPADPSRLDKSLQKKLSMDFKDAMLKQVFEVFARTTQVNFVFDKDVRTDQKVTVFLNGTSTREALDVVLFTNQLEQRILDGNTILIYPNTPAKLKDYQPLTVRGFFLANADAEQVAGALKSLLKMKDIVVDKRQNLITVRDTVEGIRLAEKLVKLHDLPEPEVMLDVEVLEINRNRLTELGIKYPTQLTLTPLTAVSGDTLTVSDLRNVGAGTLGASITPAVINARRQTSDFDLLANPRIRVRNRDNAKILIGDKVPNITTTSTSTGFVASNVQYLDVGLKLEVTPIITVDNEIAIKIALEVSNIANQITTAEGTVAYQIGTRSASTVLRLKDGENQVLAGLINDDDRRSANKVPGLGDLPLLGRLFSSHLEEGKKTEIVLSITPRLVRDNLHPGLAVTEFESGTETSMRGLTVHSGAAQPAVPAARPAAGGAGIPPPSPASPPADSRPGMEAPAAAASAAVARWEAPAQVRAGATFTVRLRLASSQPLTGAPAAIGFDPGKFELLDVREGNLLAQNGGATSFSQRIDKASGQVFIAATRVAKDGGNAGASGEGILASLTVRAMNTPGSGDFRLVTIAPIGLNGTGIPTNVPQPHSVAIVP